MSNKLNTQQHTIIDCIIAILQNWKTTNDFTSPTISNHMNERIDELDILQGDKNSLEMSLDLIQLVVKENE